ncbi:DUF47 domain-containing protein [Hyperthermus butylicus]|uniref:Phosphate transport regulator n=1 Tax=Hyperthermus butylicus (strain DSM 5456 / JCM 9403 / PLM1-5) TaxID=415426 RepID=A2BIW3_HYPBU|nr:DUF47 family protein [Hyperthermus butylicus]ABM79924.1 putative phosphate transport regulator [Hyperthermus butylicus DSM 5456]
MAEEYYDYDIERRRQQSLAEESLTEQIVGVIRELSKEIAGIRSVIDALVRGDTEQLGRLHSEIRSAKDRVEAMKDDALTYLARLGNILTTNTIYKDLFLYLTSVAQSAEGIAYRAYLLSSNTKSSILSANDVTMKLKAIAETLSKEFESLEKAINHLWSNPKKSYEEAQRVLNIENDVDALYRELVFSLYRELKSDIVALMLIKDITDLIEDIADTIRDAAENVKFLALYMVAGR